MTRFLSGILGDPLCASFNEETKRLFEYHQATKHTYQSVRADAHYLDWSNQPDPFRTYEGAPVTVLPPEPGFPNTGTFAAMGALDGEHGVPLKTILKTATQSGWTRSGSVACFGIPWQSVHGRKPRAPAIATACASTPRQEIFTPRKHI